MATRISGVIGLTGGKYYAPLFKVARSLGESPVAASSNKTNAAGTGPDGATPPDSAMFGGELYFYRKPSTGWRSLSKPDGVLYDPGAPPLYGLGVSVAVENGTIVGGANVNDGFGDTPGAVCIFRPNR
jgi:hypothetical protein